MGKLKLEIPEYGSEVYCDFADEFTFTKRPGKSGPWFCHLCGSTTHPPINR